MKKSIYYINMFCILVVVLSSCGSNAGKEVQIKMTPLEYNDAIIGEQSKIIKAMLDLSKSFQNSNPAIMDENLDVLIKQTYTSIEVLEKMKPYDGNNTLRAAALELFKFYNSLSKGEFNEIVNIIKKKPNFTSNDIKRMDVINQSIAERETVLDKNLSDAQHTFSTKYGFSVEKNKLQNELDSLGK